MVKKLKLPGKRIIRFGTSWGITLEKPVLACLEITDNELQNGLSVDVTIEEKLKTRKEKDKLFAKLATEQMEESGVNSMVLELADPENKMKQRDDEIKNETKTA